MAAGQVAQAAIKASAEGSATKPLLGGDEERKDRSCSERFKEWFCANPLQNLPIVLLLAAGVICLVGAAFTWRITVAVLGFCALAFGGYQIWALRNLKAEVDRFSKENAKLEATEERLENQVGFLKGQKGKLETKVTKLEHTVVELKDVSDGLEKELDGFEKLKQNFEKFASDTGHDISKVMNNANKIYSKMQENTVNNEKALLGKIAQDLEFVDRDVGMSKEEFNKWLDRIPEKLRKKYENMGFTYEAVAGEDGTIDFMEVENLIQKLVEETDEKLKEMHIHK